MLIFIWVLMFVIFSVLAWFARDINALSVMLCASGIVWFCIGLVHAAPLVMLLGGINVFIGAWVREERW